MNRRRLLSRTGVVLVAAVAGCTGEEDGTTPGRTATATPTARQPTAADSPTDQPTRTPTESSTDEPARTTTESVTEDPTETTTETPTETDTPTETATATPTPDYTVVVGPEGTFRFDPSQLTVTAGETVEWVWDSSNHNVRPGDIPAEAEWSGTPGGDGTTYDAGYVYQYTFSVTGQYDYYCAPHRNLGMTGSLTVE